METFKGILTVLITVILLAAAGCSEAQNLTRDQAKKIMDKQFYPVIICGKICMSYDIGWYDGTSSEFSVLHEYSKEVRETVKNLEREGFISLNRTGRLEPGMKRYNYDTKKWEPVFSSKKIIIEITITEKGQEYLLPSKEKIYSHEKHDYIEGQVNYFLRLGEIRLAEITGITAKPGLAWVDFSEKIVSVTPLVALWKLGGNNYWYRFKGALTGLSNSTEPIEVGKITDKGSRLFQLYDDGWRIIR